MTVATADLHKAIAERWQDSGLDWDFKQLWDEADRDGFPSLHDAEAGPEQPFPYCVFHPQQGTIAARMTGHSRNEKHQIHDVPWSFHVHARARDTRSGKQVAADLMERILLQFGGHPNTAPPQDPVLDNGYFLIGQYQTDYGIRTGDDTYQWNIDYIFKLDVPVMVA